MWIAIKDRFPRFIIQGCTFHWTQAVFRRVQELGLQRAYNERGDIFSFLRQVMALPFLPPEHIVPVFQHLEQRTRSNLRITMNYIWRQWITNPVFPVKKWSVFMLSVRTNNDLEGWHNRLNRHVKQQGSVPFYLLLTELYKEAENFSLQARLLSEGKMESLHRKKFRELNGRLFQKWEEYNNGGVSTTQLLRFCASLYGPVPV